MFDLSIALTGLSERDARKLGLDVDAAYVLPAHIMPGIIPVPSPCGSSSSTNAGAGESSAQIVGRDGVDKRIDVIATAIHFRGTIDDLAALDLAYAPQFASAKDPVHMAAFVAQNQMSGQMTSASPASDVHDELLLDVRSADEYAAGTLDGAINIPLDELRGRIHELDPHRSTLIFCQAGQRGYVAQRILLQRGFADVRNIKGGYSLARRMLATHAFAGAGN